MLPEFCRRSAQLRLRAAETRCRCRLPVVTIVHKGAAGLVVWVVAHLIDRQYRSVADVDALEYSVPLIAGFGAEDGAHPVLHRRPVFHIPLVAEVLRVLSQDFQQCCIELWFDRAQGNIFAIGGFVDLIKMCAAIEKVGAALLAPEARLAGGESAGHQGRRAVDHGGVHDLALP